MFTGDAEYLEGFEVEMAPITEPSTKRKRCNFIKKWTVQEEKALVEFLMENLSFEKPTAQNYYKRFAEVAKVNVHWKVARNKLRNMRTAYNRVKGWESSTGAGAMNGETMRATLLRKCHYFYQFDEIFGARLADNIVIEDTLDESLSSDAFNTTNDTTASSVSVSCESSPSTSRRGPERQT